MSPIPLKLNFQPSLLRKEQRSPKKGAQGANNDDSPVQDLESYLESAENTNLYPSLSSAATVAPFEDLPKFNAKAEMEQDPNERPKCFRNNFEEWIFVFAVMMATSSTTFIQGVIVINTATIGKDLKMNAAQITWIAAAIGLASGSFMLFFGKTADLFGRKPQLLAGMSCLSLFALITAFAPNPMAMNILCGFLGLGTAVISPPAIGTLFATYPEGRRRNRATGALGSGNPIGFILGSVSSGVATKCFGWRASFIVVAIFFFVLSLFAFWTMPSIPRSENMKKELKRFDWFGTVLTIMGMALFCAALTEGPVRGWESATVITMLIIGFFLLVGFAFWEHIYKFPLLNPSVWGNRNYTLCVLSVLFGYMSFITNQFWISLYMQEVQNFTPLVIATRLLPQAIAGIIWSYIGQALIHRWSGTVLMGIGAVAYLLGAILQIFIRQHTSYWKLLFPSLLITVMGADFQFIVSNLYVSKQMPAQSSLAAGVLQTAMRLSVSLGLSITAAVYGSSLNSPQARADITFAFDRAFLCSILFAVIGLSFVPFMRIGKQGGTPEVEKEKVAYTDGIMDVVEEEPPRSAGEYTDVGTQTIAEEYPTLSTKSSENSLQTLDTVATYGSERPFFPRWSWEAERQARDRRYLELGGDGHVSYEICFKCRAERRVTVGIYGGGRDDGYEPTPVHGGQPTTEAKTYDVRLLTPIVDGEDYVQQGEGSAWV